MLTVGLAKHFGQVQALRSLDLEVASNSIFALVGPNGSGKTTAMRILLGLIRPTGGRATVLGMDVTQASLAIRRRIGYLPQEPRFYDDLSPRQTLAYARRFFPVDPSRTLESEVDQVLELVGLGEKKDQPAGELSGGQRQRLGIAQAQIHRPDLLILDEPASALDPLGRRDVLDIMRRLQESSTILYSTHILDDVQQVSDTVAVINHGETVAQAEIGQLLGGSGSVGYEATMRGDHEGARKRLLAQPWVVDATTRVNDGAIELQVAVNDDDRAERELLRLLLADDQVDVTRFSKTVSELEDVFVELVEGAER